MTINIRSSKPIAAFIKNIYAKLLGKVFLYCRTFKRLKIEFYVLSDVALVVD